MKQGHEDEVKTEQWFVNALMGKDADHYFREHRQDVGRLIPEMIPCFDFEQNNKYHVYDVYEHILKALSYTPRDLIIRTAVFFHDIGKPGCYTEDEHGVGHYKGHGRVSAEMTELILDRLNYSESDRCDIVQLIFYHDATFVSGKRYVRRWLNRIGEKQFRRLIEVKRADIYGHNPIYTEEGLHNMDRLSLALEAVLKEEEKMSTRDLELSGKELIEMGCPEGAMVGIILKQLLELVNDGTLQNDHEILAGYARKLLDKTRKTPE